MASKDAESDTEVEEAYGIIRPTVLEQIKDILEQYRNDVQIIKEIIQNADDAGASEMKILYEGHTINEEIPNEKHFRKFIRAPALVFYNDAVFNEKDWEGMRSIGKSEKAKDSFKVGRYGLGFKSTFHLTDYPSIISGNRVMFIDPQEKDEKKICTVIKLKNLCRSTRINISEFRDAFDGTFNFDQQNLNSGIYPHTIFWFPLRQQVSLLSDLIYSETNVRTLLDSFLQKPEWNVVFTKTLCKIDIYVNINTESDQSLEFQDTKDMAEIDKTQDRTQDSSELRQLSFGRTTACFSIRCESENGESIRDKKLEIQNSIDRIGHIIPPTSQHWYLDMQIKITRVSHYSGEDTKVSRCLVVLFLKGGQMSKTMQRLIDDDSFCYHHLVGIAARLDLTYNSEHENDVGGHVFCFQPLPQESHYSTTGLPVHINASFALGNDRRQIKWEDDETMYSSQADHAIDWNHALLDEVLPFAYLQFIQQSIEQTTRSNVSDKRSVYNIYPRYETATYRWKALVKSFYDIAKDKNILFSSNCGGKWLPMKEVIILTESKEEWHSIVDNLLITDNIETAVIPESLLKTIQDLHPSDFTVISPSYLAYHMLRNSTYTGLLFEQKLSILQYILSDPCNDNYENLELLPLDDGKTFTKIGKDTNTPVFLEEIDVIELYPSKGSRFVSRKLPIETRNILENMLTEGKGRMMRIDSSNASNMLRSIIKLEGPSILVNREKWLENFWKFIQFRFDQSLDDFVDLNFFPVCVKRDRPVELCKLTDHILLVKSSTMENGNIMQVMQLLSIRMVSYVPKYLRSDVVNKYVYDDSMHGLISLFQGIKQCQIDIYNESVTKEQQTTFVQFLSDMIHGTIPQACISNLKKLKLFQQYRSNFDLKCSLVAITDNSVVFKGDSYPIKYPRPAIRTRTSNELTLAEKLGATVYDQVDMIIETLQGFYSGINDMTYSVKDRSEFMFWLLQDTVCIDNKEVRTEIMELKTEYVETVDGSFELPTKLFDPTDVLLQQLFKFEDKFPAERWSSNPRVLQNLRTLGLLTLDDLKECHLKDTCRFIHNTAADFNGDEGVLCKAEAVLKILNSRCDLCGPYLDELQIVPIKPTQVQNVIFPKCLKTKNGDLTSLQLMSNVSSFEYVNLIGTVCYTIDCKLVPDLAEQFKWSEKPKIEWVLKHLENVINMYTDRYKAEYVVLITRVYEWLAEQNDKENIASFVSNHFNGNRFVWNGESFVTVHEVYTCYTRNDIDLAPFASELPKEFNHLKDFFEDVGCAQTQSADLYHRTLNQIKSSTEKTDFGDDKYATHVTIAILNKIVSEELPVPVAYIPVQKDSILCFKPIDKCAYYDDNDPLIIDGNNDIYQVHPDLTIGTAKALGVLSFRHKLLSDTVSFEEWGQEESLTTKIRNLIKHGYTDGFAVIKEMFQNAEDAKAKGFSLLFDYRENENARSSLLCEKLGAYQGPALWIYNDAIFSEEDLKNIRKLGEATKHNAPERIGKFGLGFCSVYNITDLPSLFSGHSLVIFDPHSTNISKSLQSKSPGLRIDFKNGKNTHLQQRFIDQFKPFENVFGCNICTQSKPYFNGTLFRLPFRTQRSELSDIIYTNEHVEALFETIADEISNLLLFNESIKDISVWQLPKNYTDPSDAVRQLQVVKQCRRIYANYDDNVSVMSEITQKRNVLFRANRLTLLEEVTLQTRKENLVLEDGSWLVSTASSNEDRVISLADGVNELPIAAAAIPVRKSFNAEKESYKAVQLQTQALYFCTLPLGQQRHNFPFHVSGHFRVSMDRQYIIKYKSDEQLNNTNAIWNQMLMEDNLVTALICLLTKADICDAYELWPGSCVDEFENKFVKSFYNRISSKKSLAIFTNKGERLDYLESRFLCHEALEYMKQYQISVSTICILAADSSLIVDIPPHILEQLNDVAEETMKSRVISADSFILSYFLPNVERFLHDLSVDDRNNLLKFSLMLHNKQVKLSLKETACIPTDDGKMKRPSDLIYENSEIGKLFPPLMGFFPQRDFASESLKHELLDIGLRYELLSNDMVLNRAREILFTYQRCAVCAKHLCRRLLKYLAVHISSEEHIAILKELSFIPFLPVMRKPSKWPLTWFADSCTEKLPVAVLCNVHLEIDTAPILWRQPHILCAPTVKNILGCTQYFVDTDLLNKSHEHTFHLASSDFCNIFDKLGIKQMSDTFEDSLIIDNLLMAADSVSKIKSRQTEGKYIANIFQDIYECLEKTDTLHESAQKIKNKEIIWMADRLVSQEVVSCDSSEKLHLCHPFIFSITDSPMCKCQNLCKALDIRDCFTASEVATHLKELKLKYKDSVIEDKKTESIIALLKLLKSCFDTERITDLNTFLTEFRIHAIYAPDENNVLQSCTEMCFDDSAIEKSDTMIYVHRDVPRAIALEFGVVSKSIHQLKECSDDIIDFYQKEPLVQRIRRLIDGYPCDSGLFKELLQNADDAGASEVTFMLDFDHHSVDHIFNEESEILQSPALCVFNDCSFSRKDLEGIQNLGHGGKFGDVAAIGCYGVGFNSVYNLTDVPSFLTKGSDVENGETMCIFDPLAKHLPDVKSEKPGKRYKDVNVIRKSHSDILRGYHEKKFFRDNTGTMFRFPLRTDVSGIKPDTIVESDELEQILHEFTKELSHAVIFLRNVKNVTVIYHRDGNYTDKYKLHINATGTNVEKRRLSSETHRKLCDDYNKKPEKIFDFVQTSVDYEIEIETIDDKGLKDYQEFTVVQTFGFRNRDNMLPLRCVKEINNSFRLPQGGVARPIHDQKCEGKAFCFLPLPISTGLQCHINGHFALDHETRRTLWKAEDTDHCLKTQWNIALVREVISQAYIIFMGSLIRRFSHTYPGNMEKVCAILNCFPSYQHADSFYWKCLTSSFYEQLFNDNLRFLPSLHVTLHKKKMNNLNITWENPVSDCEHCPLYTSRHFDNEKDINVQIKEINEKETNKDDQHQLISVLRDLGIRIVDVPDFIIQSMENSDLQLKKLSPEHVINFLRSYDDSKCECCDLKVGRNVAETAFKTPSNVNKVIEFCSSSTNETLVDVPLVLTKDEILRTLSRHQTILVTNFVDLFPCGMSHLFLHESLNDTICLLLSDSKYDELFGGMLKTLTLTDFVTFASKGQTIFTYLYRTTHVPLRACDCLHVSRFWEFFTEDICYRKDQEKTQRNREKMRISGRQLLQNITIKSLRAIEDLCLIPAICRKGNDQMFITFSEIDILIQTDSFVAGTDIHTAVSMFDIYELNKAILHDVASDNVYASDILLDHISKCDTPLKLLKCFIVNVDKISKTELNTKHAKALLRYFYDHLGLLTENIDVREMKQFPFFETFDGDLKAIDRYTKVFTLPDDIPRDGLSEISRYSDIIFLKDLQMTELYNKIGILTPSIEETYIALILPGYEKMTDIQLYSHVRFVCKYLTIRPDASSSCLMHAMKYLPFIEVGSARKRVQDLFYDNPKHAFFSIMCEKNEMLPEIYHKTYMLEIFKQIGLQWEMTAQLFERFAREIERSPMRDGSKNRSKLLLKRMIKDKRLHDINFTVTSNIKFIFPKQIGEQYTQIHEQHNTTSPVSFCESVYPTQRNMDSCWTTQPILPNSELDIRNGWTRKLHIIQKPSGKHLINHCRNIGNSLERKLPHLQDKCKDNLKNIMDHIYETFESDNTTQTLNELMQIPIIYSPDDGIILHAANVVITCSSEDEISPYIVKVPTYFARYEELFIKLGASKEVTANHYVRGLRDMFRDFGSVPLSEEKKISAYKAMVNLFVWIKINKDIMETSSIYLLDERNCFKKGSDLVVCDNRYLRERVEKGICLDYMADICRLEFHKLMMNDIVDGVKLLSPQHAPQILSAVVREEVDLTNIRTDLEQTEAKRLQKYLTDEKYINCFCRLTRHAMKKDNLEWTDTIEENIKSHIRNIRCKQAECIETHLVRNQCEPIKNTSEPKLLHIYTEDSTTTVLFETNDSSDWRKEVHNNITAHLNSRVGNCLQNELLFLAADLLDCARTMKDCNLFLDEKSIEAYGEVSRAVVPYLSSVRKPGTYVPHSMVTLLTDDWSEPDEFMAIETDPQVPTYMFVKVLECEQSVDEHILFQRYTVDAGEESPIVVKAFQLFAISDSRCDELKNADHQSDLSYDVICKEIKETLELAWSLDKLAERKQLVFKLIRKWHADENPEQTELATKVFQFIHACIRTLEGDEDFSKEDTNADTESTECHLTRQENLADWFKQEWQRYTKSSRFEIHDITSQRSFYEDFVQQPPYHNISEAERWQRQAKSDLDSAEVSIAVYPRISLNWVCYQSHQAAEKALKAAWYARDANKCDRCSHLLTSLAVGLNEKLVELTQHLETLTGAHTRMRYPDTMTAPDIPADYYTREKAEKCCQIATEIYNQVDEQFVRYKW